MADPITIDQIRQKYPQYKDMPDADLANGLHQKFYSDMPFDQFSAKIGFKGAPPAATTAATDEPRTALGVLGGALQKSVAGTGDNALSDSATGIARIPGQIVGLAGDAGKNVVHSVRDFGSQITGQGPTSMAAPKLGETGDTINKAIGLGPLQTPNDEHVATLASLVAPGGIAKVLGGLGKALGIVPVAAAASAPGTAAEAAAAASARGFKIPPSAIVKAQPRIPMTDSFGKPSMAKAQSLVPGATVEQQLADPVAIRNSAITHNQGNATSIAATDGGMADTGTIEPEAIEAAKVRPAAEYNRTGKAIGTAQATTGADGSVNLDKALDGIAQKPGLEPDIRAKIAAQVEKYKTTSASGLVNGDDTMKTISVLRARAAKQIQSNDIGMNDQGYANRSIAGALEDEMEAQLVKQGNPGQIAAYREARQQFAKLHDIETATEGGQISSAKIAKMAANGVQFSGGLKDIADFAGRFPDVAGKIPALTGDKAGTLFEAVKNKAAAAGNIHVERVMKPTLDTSVPRVPKPQTPLSSMDQPDLPMPHPLDTMPKPGGPGGPIGPLPSTSPTTAGDLGLGTPAGMDVPHSPAQVGGLGATNVPPRSGGSTLANIADDLIGPIGQKPSAERRSGAGEPIKGGKRNYDDPLELATGPDSIERPKQPTVADYTAKIKELEAKLAAKHGGK
jgi:hypothetical protein